MVIINQPKTESTGKRIESLLNEEYDTFYAMVAYAKKSGVIRLKSSLERFKENGGVIKIIVGIDQKNTSLEAIELLNQLCDELYIYHSEVPTQTYHPKIYMIEKRFEKAHIFVGSSNLTAGGLYTNYEANVYQELNLKFESDQNTYDTIIEMFSSYSDEKSPCCKKVTDDLIKQLVEMDYLSSEESLSVQIIREAGERRNRARIFGSENYVPPRVEEVEMSVEETESTSGNTMAEEEEAVEVYRVNGSGFWKRLSKYDVSLTSSPGQIIIPIGFSHLFPHFRGWTTTSSGAEQADVNFNIIYKNSTGTESRINGVRAIQYVPAPDHPRPNRELRFTFLNKDILRELNAGDVLKFEVLDDPEIWFRVELIRKGTSEDISLTKGKRYSLL
jgi:HKD family nuclease